jgi:hypothetical protein
LDSAPGGTARRHLRQKFDRSSGERVLASVAIVDLAWYDPHFIEISSFSLKNIKTTTYSQNPNFRSAECTHFFAEIRTFFREISASLS